MTMFIQRGILIPIQWAHWWINGIFKKLWG